MNETERKYAIATREAVEDVLAAFKRAMYPSSYESQLAARLEEGKKALVRLLGE
jgi:hypothetical protein